MKWHRARICSVLALMSLGVIGAISNWANGGFSQPSGIKVDADGVLRTLVFKDPTGQLTRQRINAAKASLNRDLMKPSKLRKVSLNRLEREIEKLLALSISCNEVTLSTTHFTIKEFVLLGSLTSVNEADGKYFTYP